MTVQTETRKHVYPGNGVATAWPVAFLFYENSHILVKIKNAGNEDWNVLSPEVYNVSGAGTGSGTITYPLSGAPLPSSSSISIERIVPFVQEGIQLDISSGFDPEIVEREADLAVMRDQQLRDGDGGAGFGGIGTPLAQAVGGTGAVSMAAARITKTGGSTARRLGDVLGEILTPQDFDGGPDKTAGANAIAFQAMLDALETRRYGAAYIPAGRYLLSESLFYAVTGAATGLSIIGAGRDVTVLEFTGTTSGNGLAIEVDPGPAQDALAGVHLEGFTILSAVPAASGAGIVVNGTLPASDIEGGPVLLNVAVRAKSNVLYWATGIAISNWGRSTIMGCEVTGPQPGVFAPANLLGTGISYNFPGDHKISDTHVHTVDKAVNVQGETEGLHCTNCTFVAVNYGVYWDASGVEPLLEWTGGHINAYFRCIYTRDVRQISIKGGLYYHFQIGTPSLDWVGIHLRDGSTASVTDAVMEIEGSATLDQDGVLIDNFDYAKVSVVATNGDGATRGKGAGVRITGGCQSVTIDATVKGWSRGVEIEAGANRSVKVTGNFAFNGVHVFAGASVSARTIALTITGCTFGDATETLFYVDSVAVCNVTGCSASRSGAAPALGDYVIVQSNAVGGSYQSNGNHWPDDGISFTGAESFLRGTDERGSMLTANGSGTVSSGGAVVIATGLVRPVRIATITPTNSAMGAGTWYVSKSAADIIVTAPNGSTFDWQARA